MRNRTRPGSRPATHAIVRPAVEPLEPRRLLAAAISGTLFQDANSNYVQDSTEPGLAARAVYLDINDNSILDAGEPVTITSDQGVYAFTGLDEGAYTVRQVLPGGESQTFPRVDGAPGSKFKIDFSFAPTADPVVLDGKVVDVPAIFQAAARRWEQIIVGDVPNAMAYKYPNGAQDVDPTDPFNVDPVPQVNGRPVDDILINALIGPIDGPGGILGASAPIEFRGGWQYDPTNPSGKLINGDPDVPDTYLPTLAVMQFDSEDITDLGQFYETVLHEMGHSLGFGTIWEDLNLVSQEFNTLDYLGANGAEAYRSVFDPAPVNGLPVATVPYENTGGPGSVRSHWRESVFGNELMSPIAPSPSDAELLSPGLDADGNPIAAVPVLPREPLSRVTAASMADLGYDAYLPSAAYYAPADGDGAIAPGFYGTKPVMDPFAYTVTLRANEKQKLVNFGSRVDAAPTNVAVRTPTFAPALTADEADAFNAATAAAAADDTLAPPVPTNAITVQALGVADRDDAVYAVNFYRESNGRRGLQTSGPNPDTFIAQDTSRAGGWKVTTATDGLAAGVYTYYSRAFDSLLKFTDSAGSVTLVPPVTLAPPQVTRLAVTPLSQTSLRIQFDDNGTQAAGNQEIGTRVEVSTTQTFDKVLVFNYGPDVNDVTIDSLAPGTTYYVRARASNDIGQARYSATNFATTFVPGEIVLDNPARTGTVVRGGGSIVKARGAWAAIANSPEARLDGYLTSPASDGSPSSLADAIYQPNLPAGRYFVYATFSPQKGNTRSAPIDIFDRDGTHGFKTVTVDETVGSRPIYSDVPQTLGGEQLLGAFDFAAGPAGFVRVRNYGLQNGFGPLLTRDGTQDVGRVVADSIRFVPASGATLARANAVRLLPTPPARTTPFATAAEPIRFDANDPADPEDLKSVLS